MTTTAAPIAGRFAPSVLNPNDATIVACWDDDPTDGWMRPSREMTAHFRNGLAPEGRERGGLTRCTMCGAGLRYVNVAVYIPTGEFFVVGDDCAANIEYAADVECKVSDLRARAATGRANARRQTEWQRVLDADVDFAVALDYLLAHDDDFGRSVEGYGLKNGRVSDKQRDAIIRAAERHAARLVREAERAAAEAANPPAPIPDDVLAVRGTITGVILGTRWVDNAYGGALKMLVRDDRGFKVWGTAPDALFVESRVDTGIRVEFDARVERGRNNDDPCFGFFTRPTKARRIDPAA